jgi:predicted nucleic acid-binding protein
MKVLLDTNVYTAFKRGRPTVLAHIRTARQVVFSTIVAGELLFGFRYGARFEHNWAELQAFLDSPRVSLLPVTLDTADRFGRISAQLRRRGRPIPTNDVWIAAHAMESGAELLSFDAHFEAIHGLAWTSLDAI